MDEKEKNTLSEESKVQLDIKALVGMVLGLSLIHI